MSFRQPDPGARRTQSLSRPWVRRLWLTLAILDLLFLYAVWMRIQLWRGRCVVADRYWQDTKLDFSLNFPTASVPRWWLWRTLEWLAPVPHVAVLLTIPVAESMRRCIAKREPFPTPVDQLEERARQYENSGSQPFWTRFDGMQDATQLADAIGAAVMRAIRNADPPQCSPQPEPLAATPLSSSPEHLAR